MKGDGVKPSLIKGAMLLRRNLLVLIASFAALRIISPIILDWFITDPSTQRALLNSSNFTYFGLALIIYAGFVIQSLTSKEFKESYAQKEMIIAIKKESEANHLNARILKRKLELKAQQRLDSMLRESDEIVHSFMNGDKTHLKLNVVKQSLKLTSAYIKLADMFRVRSSASNSEKISQLAKRINTNTSNMNSVKDRGIADELQRVIDADERMIESLKNERLELDKIDARLQYMESTIGMLKYNIISNLESDDILNHLESDVYEADVLNSVLNERYDERREERRIRL